VQLHYIKGALKEGGGVIDDMGLEPQGFVSHDGACQQGAGVSGGGGQEVCTSGAFN
jgi:hypothetical protein